MDFDYDFQNEKIKKTKVRTAVGGRLEVSTRLGIAVLVIVSTIVGITILSLSNYNLYNQISVQLGAAGEVSIYLQSDSESVYPGESFSVEAIINTQSESINAVTLMMGFNSAVAEVDSIDFNGSVFPIGMEDFTFPLEVNGAVISQPEQSLNNYNNNTGAIYIVRGARGSGYNGEGGMIARINFAAKSPGSLDLGLTYHNKGSLYDTDAVRPGDNPQDILGSVQSVSISVLAVQDCVPEICSDGIDQDCDGMDLECDLCGNGEVTFRCLCEETPVSTGHCCQNRWQAYPCEQVCTDNDGDGYSPEGGTCGPTDCDDNNPFVYPGRDEICSDGIDQNCDGIDALCALCTTMYIDEYGCRCAGKAEYSGFCCNNSWSESPCQSDGGGNGANPIICTDNDGDGYYQQEICSKPDCDDNNPFIYPGAKEICGDGIDQNCDGLDAKCPTCGEGKITRRCLCGEKSSSTGYCCQNRWQVYPCEQVCTDNDGDGYSPEGGTCGPVDCDDNDFHINMDVLEICSDGIDQNCDGMDAVCPACPSGKIIIRCFCGEAIAESGYCCGAQYQTHDCTSAKINYRDYFGEGLDSDNDGIPDEKEINLYGTDPFNSDTDGDGYEDGHEIYHTYPPLSRHFIYDYNLVNRLSGWILLQVEERGEAWYLNPGDKKRHYLGRPHNAFDIMRFLSVGITDKDLDKIPINKDNWQDKTGIADKLSGRIVLQVEQNGEAWYIYPKDKKRYYLGRPYNAFDIMRNLGLGIKFNDLIKIPK